jgi:DNA-binding transcriptional ArsR family regulator
MAFSEHSLSYALDIRAQILCLLSQVELDTAQLAAEMMLARSSILNHLSILQAKNLVSFHLVNVDRAHTKQVHYATYLVRDKIKAMQVIQYGIPPANADACFTILNQLCTINNISTKEYAVLLKNQERRIHQEKGGI